MKHPPIFKDEMGRHNHRRRREVAHIYHRTANIQMSLNQQATPLSKTVPGLEGKWTKMEQDNIDAFKNNMIATIDNIQIIII